MLGLSGVSMNQNMKQNFSINNRPIGIDHAPYIIAEMSANHNGDINNAYRIIDMAKACGADAVKMQTYTADTITLNSTAADFQIHGGLWDGRTLYDLYQKLTRRGSGINHCLTTLTKSVSPCLAHRLTLLRWIYSRI